MKHAIHYDADDIKAILAERHGVDAKNVIRNQYSYTVVLEKEVKDDEKSEDQPGRLNGAPFLMREK